MTPPGLLVVVIGLAVVGWAAARLRAEQLRPARGRPAMLPAHAGGYVAAWTALPGLAALALAGAAASRVWPAVLLAALAGGGVALALLRPGFEARGRVERAMRLLLLGASLLAIVTTVGIAGSLLVETARFFRLVPANQFLFGLHWSPQNLTANDPGAVLGALPLFWGTILIAVVIAMAVAIPFGLGAAIWLGHYAGAATRSWAKPLLEMLGGVPSVIYGYVAAVTVAPAVRRLGLALGVADASAESALASGLVLGTMIIPYVASTADDALAAVAPELRDASLALGATGFETIRLVLLPAAMPGIGAGILLAVSRAVGETMIVVMAASAVATLTLDPFASATTVTRQIVDLLTGETAFDSPKTLAAFALGLTLFCVTLLINIVALRCANRYGLAHD